MLSNRDDLLLDGAHSVERDVLSAQTLLAISHRVSKSERFKGGGDYHPSIAYVLLAEAARISAG